MHHAHRHENLNKILANQSNSSEESKLFKIASYSLFIESSLMPAWSEGLRMYLYIVSKPHENS